jgi:hypothetical protein
MSEYAGERAKTRCATSSSPPATAAPLLEVGRPRRPSPSTCSPPGGTPGGHRGGVRLGRLGARHRRAARRAAVAAGKRVILPVLLPDNDLDWAVYAGRRPGARPARAARAGRPAARAGRDRDRRRVLVPGLAVSPTATGWAAAAAPTTARSAGCPVGTFTCVLLHDDEVRPRRPRSEPHDRPGHGRRPWCRAPPRRSRRPRR